MAGSLNKVLIIGNLTRDPELKYLPSGVAVCTLAVATNSYSSDPQTGDRREFTEFHSIEVWNQGNRKLAELCAQYLQKGRKVYVEGELRTRSWDDAQTGTKRYRTEIRARDVQFLDSRSDGAATGGGGDDFAGARPAGRSSAPAGGDIDPDDIPF
jgi:single-strand DNA-binding protein